MRSRSVALALTGAAAALLLLFAPGESATAVGLLAALVAVAAIWLATGRVRMVLGVLAAAGWLVGLVMALGVPAAIAAAVMGLAAAVVIVVAGPQWPGFSARYARGGDVADDELASPRHLWESLDRGEDPTQGPEGGRDDTGSG